MKLQQQFGWAICSDHHMCQPELTRSVAITRFMKVVGEPRKSWPTWKRKGWRCSRVAISELIFGKGK